jgi:SSS family solute:Na+ symporter
MNVAATKYSLVISFLVSIAIAIYMPSVIRIWYTIGTIIIPGLLVPLMAGYFDRKNMNGTYAFVSMLLGWGTSVTWLVLGYTGGAMGTYPLGIEPMYPGLVVSIGVWAWGRHGGNNAKR